MDAIEIITLIVLLILSGFFSGVETAFISLGRVRLRRMIEEDRKNAELIKKLKDDPHKLISTLLIGNNLVNIAASAFATSIAIKLYGDAGIGIATGVMTFAVLVFGEITPKTIAMSNSEKICAFAAPLIYFLGKLLKPVIWLSDLLTKKLTSIFGKENKGPMITEEEIKSFVSIGEEIGSIEKDEKEMIHNIFEMNDTEIKEIMVPKINILYVKSDKKIREVLDDIIKSGHSRVPVYNESEENFVGVIYTQDIMKEISKSRFSSTVGSIMRKAYFVPETKKADSLLQEFQRKKIHIAMVVNEYGEVTGLITLEDVLEEIVGEIYDETDEVKIMIKKTEENVFEMDGETTILELREKTGLKIRQSKDYNTICGYLLNRLSRIPNNGEKLEFKRFDIKINQVKNNRIVNLELTINE